MGKNHTNANKNFQIKVVHWNFGRSSMNPKKKVGRLQ